MFDLDPLIQRLVAADSALALWHREVDIRWDALRDEHVQRTGSGLGFLPHLVEMAREARKDAGADPTHDVYAILDQAADTFLVAPEIQRQLLTEWVGACPDIERVHLGYIGRAARFLRDTHPLSRNENDPAYRGGVQAISPVSISAAPTESIWLSRGLVVAVLLEGGRDYRDLNVALSDLSGAAREAGLDPRENFRLVASLASPAKGRGGLNGSIREFLLRFHGERF